MANTIKILEQDKNNIDYIYNKIDDINNTTNNIYDLVKNINTKLLPAKKKTLTYKETVVIGQGHCSGSWSGTYTVTEEGVYIAVFSIMIVTKNSYWCEYKLTSTGTAFGGNSGNYNDDSDGVNGRGRTQVQAYSCKPNDTITFNGYDNVWGVCAMVQKWTWVES